MFYAHSLRVAVSGLVVIIIVVLDFFLAVVFVFLFVLFLVWLLAKENVVGRQEIRSG